MTEEEQREMLQLLRDNNKMLKELLEIARMFTSPEYIQSEEMKDFLRNVNANLFTKRIEGWI